MSRNKLKLDKLTSISLVDAGDNPTAHVTLIKRKDSAASIAPPSAAAAPNRLSKVREQVVAILAKALNKTPEEVGKWWGDATEARTFSQVYSEESWEEICSEVWEMCSALCESICGTLKDSDVTPEQKATLLTTSMAQFSATLAGAIPVWTGGHTVQPEPGEDAVVGKSGRRMTPRRLATLTAAVDSINSILAETAPATTTGDADDADTPDPANDMSTPNDQGAAGTAGAAGTGAAAAADVGKTAAPPSPADVLKGVTDPSVRAAIEALEKRADDADTLARETAEKLEKQQEAAAVEALAKRFAKGGDLEKIGATAEEIGELRKLQKADEAAFDVVIKRMQAAAAQINTSALFGEIGSSGAGADSAMAKIEAKAAEIRKAEPKLTQAQAMAKAQDENPDLCAAVRAEMNGGR